MDFFKCTLPGGGSVHAFPDSLGRKTWPLPIRTPSGWQPGEWKIMNPRDELKPHYGGLHIAPRHALIRWLREEIYVAEPYMGLPTEASKDCTVATRARLVRPLYLPAHVWLQLAVAHAELALEIFVALVYPRDMRRNLEHVLNLFQVHPSRLPLSTQSNAGLWQRLQDVVDLCDKDRFSGLETNYNVEAGYYAALTIQALSRLAENTTEAYTTTLRMQAAYLDRSITGLMEDLLFRHGRNFAGRLVPAVAQPYLGPHPDFPRLQHRAKWNLTQELNNKLLAQLEIHNPVP